MSLHAERAILGAILIDPALLAEAAISLRPSDFVGPAHGRVFAAMLRAQERGAVDLVTIHAEDPSIQAEVLATLGDGVPRMARIDSWVQIVRDAAICREIRAAGEKIARLEDTTAEEGVTQAYRALSSATLRAAGRAFRSPAEIMRSTLQEMEERAASKGGIVGLRTGIDDMDRFLSGLRPGKLYVFAGRPAAGKTAAAMTIADNISMEGGRVQFFSLEMRAEELTERRLAKRSGVNTWGLSSTSHGWEALSKAAGSITGEGLWVDDSPDVPLAYIRAVSHQAVSTRGVQLIVVDYLQLVKSTGREESRQQEVAAVARGLKNLARELDVPVLALSQLNRESEREKKPTMGQLRESGEIENSADVIVLLHRPWVYDQSEDATKAKWILAKHRGGPTGTVAVKYHDHLTTFTNAELGEVW